MSDYSDIIDLPHHTSKTQRHMSATGRAAQFSSFEALTGYEALVEEQARLTDGRLELSSEEINELNDEMNYLMDNATLCPQVEIIYFIPDEKKAGGKYVTINMKIRKIDPILRTITDVDNNVISMDMIYKIKQLRDE
ncbi:MAG: hypothetical protein IKV44_01205 [Clostridia bacterium]|nr:hypothetical protein [Clostridia bacterium]